MADLNVRILLEMVDRVSGPSRKIKRELRGIGKAGKKAAKDFDLAANLNQAAEGVARLADQAKRLLVAPVVEFAEFEKSIVEVSTLIDESVISQAKLTQITEEAAAQFGGKAQAQAAALYQIISAGAGDAATATELLDAANKLAIGGVTDVEIAVDGLTTVLNAFGDEAIGGATAAADIFFAAVVEGKTDVEQMSAAIGRVAKIAKESGVTFEETAAAIATLTKQGINTREAVSGMKAALANIIKPTKDAEKEAKRLGIDFGVAALRAKGLSQFLKDITETSGLSTKQLKKLQKQSGGNAEEFERLLKASGANITSLSKLFGSIEGLNTILALSAESGALLDESLRATEDSAGKSQKAFEKMDATQSQALERGKAQFDALTRTIGEGFSPAVNDALEDVLAIAKAFTSFAKRNPELVKTLGSLLIKLVAVGGALRAVLLVTSTLSSVKGLLGLASAAGGATGKAAGLAAVLGKTATGGRGVLSMLKGNAGLILLALAAGVALGTWADEAFGLSERLAGVNRELDKLQPRGGGALLGDLSADDRKELAAAQEELVKAQAEREDLQEGFFGLSDRDLDFLTDIPDRIRDAQSRVNAVEARGRTTRKAREQRQATAAELAAEPFVGPVQLPGAEGATPVPAQPAVAEGGRVKLDVKVSDARVVTTVTQAEGNVETSIDGGIAGTGA